MVHLVEEELATVVVNLIITQELEIVKGSQVLSTLVVLPTGFEISSVKKLIDNLSKD